MRPARNALNQIAPRYLARSEDPQKQANAPEKGNIITHSHSTLVALSQHSKVVFKVFISTLSAFMYINIPAKH